MTSVVPQGTILGPTLFLVYVNKIPNVVTSSIKMFPEDTRIYREINNAEDRPALQSDWIAWKTGQESGKLNLILRNAK